MVPPIPRPASWSRLHRLLTAGIPLQKSTLSGNVALSGPRFGVTSHQAIKMRSLGCGRKPAVPQVRGVGITPARMGASSFGSPQRNTVVNDRGSIIVCSSTVDGTSPEPASDPGAASRRDGRMTYQPPSFDVLLDDACQAVASALDDGNTRLEVEFPISASIDDYKGASDSFIDFNLQLALTAAKRIHARTGKRVRLLLPDGGEYDRSSELFRKALDMAEGVSMGHLQEKSGGGLLGGLQGLFGSGDRDAMLKAAERADLFIVLSVSTVELVDAERYCNELPEDKALAFWNCELDTLRSDLGLLGFPPKDLHYRFTSRFLPVFYIRPRDYSKTVPVAPFVINYSGALFREYPGPWQVMLKQDGGMYACVAESRKRYTLGNAKEELMKAMRLNTEEEGSAMEFLRRGYKRSTWWEDDEDKEESHAWRS